jgi:hypothetical protein
MPEYGLYTILKLDSDDEVTINSRLLQSISCCKELATVSCAKAKKVTTKTINLFIKVCNYYLKNKTKNYRWN